MSEAMLPAPSSRGRNREIWVGVFVLSGLFAVIFLLFKLTGPATFRGRYFVIARVANAEGLRRGDSVQMRGVNIGRVSAFELKPGSVDIHLEVEGAYSIPADSEVEIKSSSLLGEMFAEILPGRSQKKVAENQVLPGRVGNAPFSQVNNLATEATETLHRVQKLLSDRTLANVESSTGQLDDALRELAALAADERRDLHELTVSLQRSAKNVEGALSGPQLERSMRRLDSITAQLDTTSDSLSRTAQSAETVVGRIREGQGSLGLLTMDESLYVNANSAVANLNRAAKELTELTADIRRDPKRYLKLSLF